MRNLYQGKGFFIALVLAGLWTPLSVYAYPNGISFASGSPGAGTCTNCHDGLGGYSYLASLSPTGGTVVPRNTAVTMTFSVSYLGGAFAKDTGLNVASPSGGTLSEASALLQLMMGENSLDEITHVVPQPSNSLVVGSGNVGTGYIWPSFTWTSPNSSADFTLYGCGNLVNGSRQNPLDGSGYTGDNPTCTSLTMTVNNPPVVTASGGSAAHTEQISVFVDSALTITDTEGDSLSSASITISGNYDASSGDNLTLGTCPTGASCSGSGTQTISISGGTFPTVANYQMALRSVTFNTSSDDPSTATRTVQFSVTDTFSRTSSDSRTVTVSADNDAPVLSGVSAIPTYSEGDNPGVIIDGAIAIADPDSTDCDQATVDLSTNYLAGEDILEYLDSLPAGISMTPFDSGTGTLSFSGTDTCANYETVLENVRYRNTSSNPDVSSRTVVFQVRDSATALSNAPSTTVTVQAVSTPPTVSNVSGTVGYTEDANPGVIVDDDAAVSDPDSTDCLQATVTISGNYQSGADLLEYTGSVSGISDSFSALSGQLTLSAAGSVACGDFGTALQNVRYRNNSQNPDTLTRTLSFEVRDSGNTPSSTVSKGVAVTATDDDPTAVDDVVTVAVNSSDIELDVLSNDTDPDGDALTLLSFTQPNNGGTVAAGTGSPCALNTVCYTPPADFTGINTFTYTIEDANGGVSSTATVTVQPPDTDGDGLIDFSDNCPAVSNAGQQNNDADSQGDVCDADDDNDGMSDTFENSNGFDPFNAIDAAGDADGDGRNNLDEFIAGSDPLVDDVGPIFSGVDDVLTDATGYLTPVDTVEVRSVDGAEGSVDFDIDSVTGTTAQADALRGRFRPGRTVITRSAQDSLGNIETSVQNIDIRPLASFATDRVIGEGNFIAISMFLNGEAPQYPVTVDYTLSGTADGADHDVVDGTITIPSGTEGVISINTVNDGLGEGNETLVLTLSNPVNAVLGSKTALTLTIAEDNVPPRIITLVAVQDTIGFSGARVFADQGTGDVDLFVAVDEPNGDALSFTWTTTLGTSTTNFLTFDSNGLLPGVYPVEVEVSDGTATDSTEVSIIVLPAPPALGVIDTDSDAVADNLEGYGDLDFDGVPNYLDAYEDFETTINLLQNQAGDLDAGGILRNVKLLQTDQGLFMRKGPIASFNNTSGALVSTAEIEAYASANGIASSNDSMYNIGGIYDFEIYNMQPGSSARVVLPLLARMLEGTSYRKFSLQDGWRDFSTSGDNALASARSVNGVCPAPGHASYSSGLQAYDDCIQLTLVDGGPNDADGLANGVIRDPGGVAVTDPAPGPQPPEEAEDGSGGGGVVHPLCLLLLLGWGIVRCYVPVRRRRAGHKE